nr:NADH dehydrogenase subunit 6 [Sebastapistes coniorta]
MTYLMTLLLIGFVFGMVVVASNPSPYFAAFGLVVVSALGCGVLAGYGGPFLSLILFLIYLGGMLVVFAYSAALAAEPYPMSLGEARVLLVIVLYSVLAVLGAVPGWYMMYSCSCVTGEDTESTSTFHGDAGGLGYLYSSGGWLLVVAAWVLLLTLFVVLELTRGLARGGLRAV